MLQVLIYWCTNSGITSQSILGALNPEEDTGEIDNRAGK